MKKLFLLAIFSIFMFSVSAQSIDIASEEWVNCTQKDGSGLYFDVLRLVYSDSKLNIKILPFARTVEMLENGKIDINVGNYIGDVSNGIYPKYPIDFDDLTVLSLKAFTGEESLKDTKVAWIIDYGYEKYLNVPVKLIEVSDREGGIKMLQSGRVQFYIENRSSIESSLKEMGISNKEFIFSTLKYIKLYVCFSKTEKGSQLQAIWDKRIPILIKSGELKKVFSKWGYEESYSKLLKE